MSVLSVYASPWHRHPQYLAYVAALQPAWIRHHQPQAFDLSELQRVAPQANIMLRSWDIDDNNGARKRELYDDPRAAARRLLERWDEKADALEDELRRRGLPYNRSRWYYGAWNEPDPAYIPQIVEGTAEAMRLAGLRGFRLGVVCASVGNFAKPEESANGWAAFKPLEAEISDGGHILIVHEYWQKEGPAGVWRDGSGEERHDAGNLAWRHRSIPLNVPILIGEAGANGYIFGRFSGQDDCGWRSAALGLSAGQYAAQVREYIEGCDARVQGVCLYMTDYHNGQWSTFDTLEAHGELLGVCDVRPLKPSPFLPPGPTISAPAGANVRALPATDAQILRTLAYGASVQPVARNAAGTWLLLGDGGWVYATLVSGAPAGLPVQTPAVFVPIVVTPPGEVVKQPQPDDEDWERSLAFVLRWEGGWADNPNDPGGATMRGITLATYARWCKAHEKREPTKDDLRAISDAEIEKIYRAWYWDAAGCSALAWPLCLAHFDAAVNTGTGQANVFLSKAGRDFVKYVAEVLDWCTRIGGWQHFGAAWTRRRADLLRESVK